MLKMTITWRIYILAVSLATFNGILANQPAGYLGCFQDNYGNSMVNPVFMFHDQQNTSGEYCKRMVRSQSKRYAGTKLWKCFGGDDYNRTRSTTECSLKCPGNPDEICGDGHLMVIYDTWMCITSPCENGATCNDINSDTFTCNCNAGWTGHFCNETVTSIDKQPTEPSGKSILAVSISAPLAVMIVATGVISVLVIRKRRNRKKDNSSVIDNKSETATHTFSNTVYTDQDGLTDIAVYAKVTTENKANVKITGTMEKGDYRHGNTNKDIGNEIPVDESGYGHLKSKANAVLFDPTYSHMTIHQNNYERDNTYSHIDKVTEKQRSEVILNDADADDTYSHINRSAVNLHPGVNINATDDIYNKLNINETKMNQRDRIGNQTERA